MIRSTVSDVLSLVDVFRERFDATGATMSPRLAAYWQAYARRAEIEGGACGPRNAANACLIAVAGRVIDVLDAETPRT